ncbi:hypothetical protein [Shewanella sp. YIC-542]|uniref:hypothetical protein n=1 Tax=Shewanella mytili TaxID=3377111 RepID=UPI00398F2E94
MNESGGWLPFFCVLAKNHLIDTIHYLDFSSIHQIIIDIFPFLLFLKGLHKYTWQRCFAVIYNHFLPFDADAVLTDDFQL